MPEEVIVRDMTVALSKIIKAAADIQIQIVGGKWTYQRVYEVLEAAQLMERLV